MKMFFSFCDLGAVSVKLKLWGFQCKILLQDDSMESIVHDYPFCVLLALRIEFNEDGHVT